MRVFRQAVRGRMPIGLCLLSVLLLALIVSAGPAYAATHIGATTYTSNTTWTLANSPYVLDGDVTVSAGVTLTIDPGVIVKFNGNFRIIRVNGTLSASGTGGQRITFTSLQDDAIGGDTGGDGATSGAGGQWSSLKFASSTASGTFNYVDIRYGGYGSTPTSAGAVETTNASATVSVSHSTIKWSQASGVYTVGSATIDSTTISNGGNGVTVNSGLATIRNLSAITANSNDGIYYSLGSGVSTASTIRDSDVTSNGRYGVYVVAGSTPLSLLPRASFNNINDNATKQLNVSTTPSLKNVDVNWRQNYWGQVYYRPNDAACQGVSPNSLGKLTYRGSGEGPMSGGTYLVLVNPPITCDYDSFKIDPLDIATAPLHTLPAISNRRDARRLQRVWNGFSGGACCLVSGRSGVRCFRQLREDPNRPSLGRDWDSVRVFAKLQRARFHFRPAWSGLDP